MKRAIIFILFLLQVNFLMAVNQIGIVPLVDRGIALDTFKSYTTNDLQLIYDNLKTKEIDSKTLNNIDYLTNLFEKYISDKNYRTNVNNKNKFIDYINAKIVDLKISNSNFNEKIANNNYSTINLETIQKNIQSNNDQIERYNSTIHEIHEVGPSITVEELNQLLKNNNLPIYKEEEISFKVLKVNQLEASILNNNSSWYFNHFMDINKLDGIIFITFEKISNHENLSLSYKDRYSDNQKFFDELLLDGYINNSEDSIISSIIKFFYKDISIIKIANPPKGLKIYQIASDIENEEIQAMKIGDKILNLSQISLPSSKIQEIQPISNYLILPKKDYFLMISSYKKEPYIVKLSNQEEINYLDIEGRDVIFPNVILNSEVGNLNWNINGIDFGKSTSLVLNKQLIPSVFYITKEGFANELIQYNKAENIININLKPDFFENKDLIKNKQEDFYYSVIKYIFTCASFISINTLNNIYGIESIKPVIGNLSTAMITLASFNIAHELISYIKLATK